MKKVIIDTYGADNGSETIIWGALESINAYPELSLVLVGNKEDIVKAINSCHNDIIKRIEIIETDDYITNNEPATSILERDNCSLTLALKRLKSDDECIGLLSAGNTGALLIGSIFKLGLNKGLKTPALSSAIPTYKGNLVCLVDCGANIDCTANDLARFALMGDAFIKSIYTDKNAKVGLLSVGKESGKGTKLIKEAYSLLSELPINFIGSVEGSDLVTGEVDVIVSDGFSGNILLKSVESAGKTAMKMIDSMKNYDTDNADTYTKINEKLSSVFELNARGGATFLGTEKTVIKMHGCAESQTVTACIEQLLRLEKSGFNEKVTTALSDYNAK